MLLLAFLFTLFVHHPQSQSADSVIVIKQINISGNKKTKESIILRELDLVVGDSIKKEDLEKRLDLNRRKIINTNLFVTVEVKLTQIIDNQVVIDIKLQEQWFLLGYPIFQIIDRNYAEWWQRGADLNRTTY